MSSSKISRRYAKALLSIGQEDGMYGEYGENLQEFKQFCQENREFFGVISNQVFSVDERKNILEFILKKSSFAGVVKNFLRLLLDKNRIGAIGDITDYYERLTDEISNVTRAQVIAARPLKEPAFGRLNETLTKLTAKEVKIEVDHDESLIGGLIVKIGDLVLDGSVRAQLEGLKESLKRGEYS
ncbi:MAG: ATP synthase F1 subunit delta [Desulfatiglans sp.]|nr:ATP synthase F1 subunit delta [Desulfatiglans sp.]